MVLRLLPLLSRPTRQNVGDLLLPVIAFASVTALLATIIGGAQTFWGYTDELAGIYWIFTGIAITLLVPPLLSLASAAARLSTRRRDERLAILRLLGATGRSTAALTVVESALVALVGAVVGLAVAYAATPLIGLIRFRGEALGTAGVALSPLHAVVLVAAVTLIATISAISSLRGVIISPLGVALKQQAPKTPWLQAIIAIAGITLAVFVATNLAGLGEAAGLAVVVAAMLISFAVTLLAIDLIGAWVLSLFGKAKLRRAKNPAELISARLVLESPRTAWRQVSGVAMSSFMAVFAGSGIALMNATGDTGSAEDAMLVLDVQTGIAITVIGTFIMVACSVGVSQAAQILDRRDVLRSLDIMGTPLEVQDSARKRATTLPLAIASLGSAALASVLLFPLVGVAMVLAPLSILTIAGTITAGFVIVLAALFATKPLLRRTAQAVPA